MYADIGSGTLHRDAVVRLGHLFTFRWAGEAPTAENEDDMQREQIQFLLSDRISELRQHYQGRRISKRNGRFLSFGLNQIIQSGCECVGSFNARAVYRPIIAHAQISTRPEINRSSAINHFTAAICVNGF